VSRPGGGFKLRRAPTDRGFVISPRVRALRRGQQERLGQARPRQPRGRACYPSYGGNPVERGGPFFQVKAERSLGTMLTKMGKAKAGKPRTSVTSGKQRSSLIGSDSEPIIPTLAALGVTKKTSRHFRNHDALWEL